MSARLQLGRETLTEHIATIKRAYYDSVYRVTKAALEPVVAATSDVIREYVSEAVREGVKDALSPADFIGDLISGRRKRK